MLLGLGGGVLGSVLAALALPPMRRIAAIGVPRATELALDESVLLYSVALSVAIGIAFGVAPALGASRTQPSAVLRRAGRGVVTRGRERLRASLIVAQVALAAVVLVVAALLARSFGELSRVEPGFAIAQRVTFRVTPDWGTYPGREQATVLYERFLTRLGATPGAVAVGAVNRLPLAGAWWTTQYE